MGAWLPLFLHKVLKGPMKKRFQLSKRRLKIYDTRYWTAAGVDVPRVGGRTVYITDQRHHWRCRKALLVQLVRGLLTAVRRGPGLGLRLQLPETRILLFTNL